MFSILAFGFLFGMQHALEADHLAAVSSLLSGQSSPRRMVGQGAFWGLGHTLVLTLFVGAALLLDLTLDQALAGWLEVAVGAMLVGLGLHVLCRLWRDRVHFHSHSHGDGTVHFHAHSHRGETRPHDPQRHDHTHRSSRAGLPALADLPWRALLVGMTHGLAGSAALILLTAAGFESPGLALVYVLLFGLGSVAGMAALSLVIALPLAYSARFLTWGNRLLQGTIGLATVAIGSSLLFSPPL